LAKSIRNLSNLIWASGVLPESTVVVPTSPLAFRTLALSHLGAQRHPCLRSRFLRATWMAEIGDQSVIKEARI